MSSRVSQISQLKMCCDSVGSVKRDSLSLPYSVRMLSQEMERQCTSLGSAMFGSLAAGKARGGYDDINDAAAKMARVKPLSFKPNAENHAVYARLFTEYKKLHDYFGRGENDVMKRLKGMKEEQSASP